VTEPAVIPGAPELPEGYFYRVTSQAYLGGLVVQVRQRRRWFGSRHVSESYMPQAIPPGMDEWILLAAQYAYAKMVERDIYAQAAWAIDQRAGDYRGA
jgi:hypothetical protein